ncbi:MAG: hemolysin III family protein [Ruminococcaceae bacterium]|nr:hemolysin III family protein [Oscillospiraceae bacterium]
MKRQKLSERILPTYTKGEEIFNMTSHIVGAAWGVAYLVLCVIMAAVHHNVMGVVSSAIYGATVIVLFTMSSVYHGLKPCTGKKVLQIIDHCSIYLMIAGTYTPIALCAVRGQNTATGWVLFGIIWAVTAFAATFTAIDLNKYKKLSMICYLGMGWCVVGFWSITYRAIGFGGALFLIAGGVLYTIGAVLYGLGKKKKLRYMHSVFHLFVNLASLCHFFCILFYVV